MGMCTSMTWTSIAEFVTKTWAHMRPMVSDNACQWCVIKMSMKICCLLQKHLPHLGFGSVPLGSSGWRPQALGSVTGGLHRMDFRSQCVREPICALRTWIKVYAHCGPGSRSIRLMFSLAWVEMGSVSSLAPTFSVLASLLFVCFPPEFLPGP